MKIYKITEAATPQQMTPEQIKSQQEIIAAVNQIQESVALINKSIEALQIDKIEDLFKKDGIIKALQNEEIRRLDQNKVNQSLQAMASIATSSLAINQALRVIEDNGGDAKIAIDMSVGALQTGNYSAFVSTMANFQTNLTGTTGTIQNSITNTMNQMGY
jgi:hypothetical protein